MINVTGAGPSGLSAAIELVKNDIDVTVYEKEKTVGFKFAGSYQFIFIPGSNVDGNIFLNSVVSPKAITKMFHIPIHTIKVTCLNKTIEYRSVKPIFWAVKRGAGADTIDTALLKTAEQAGVELKFESTSTKPIIEATGGKIPSGIAREFIFDTNVNDTFHIILDKRIAPGGYAYLCVIKGKATLCTAVTKNMDKIIEFSNCSLDIFSGLYNLKPTNVHAQTNYVSFDIPESYYTEKSIMVGECAGLQDALFGFGLWYSISSGILAAQSIIYDFDYDIEAGKMFTPLLKTGKINRMLYETCEMLFGNMFYSFMMHNAKQTYITDFLKSITKPSTLKIWAYDFIL